MMSLAEQVAQLEARVRRLQAERDEAVERAVQLTALLGLRGIRFPHLGVPPGIQEKLLELLIAKELVPNEIALTLLGDDTSPKTIDVHYSKLRKILAQYGVELKSRFETGRYIPREQKALLVSQ